MKRFDVLIVGTGHAGAQTALALRQRKFAGSIGMIGDEPDYPYERPPLSKEYLSKEKSFERILIRPPDFWSDRDIDVQLGRPVVEVADHHAVLQDGERVYYDKLVWAAGGNPRILQCVGATLEGVHTIRKRADVDRLMSELPRLKHIVVIGGGYIGLEAAAVLSKAGKSIVLLEALDRLLARVAGETISHFYAAEHRSHGVDIRTGARVEALEGRDGRVSAVRLEGGDLIPADAVIVGIGIEPAVEPLTTAGAVSGNGVAVDSYCRTTLPSVFAIGDCAWHENYFAGGERIRLESVQNANDQALTVAEAIGGEMRPYNALPWFWSDQFDLKLQTVGLSTGHDEVVTRGDPATRSFSVVYLKNGLVIAIDAVNNAKDYIQGRKIIMNPVSPIDLGDPSIELKSLSCN